jgi:hypothetical protein
VTRNDNDGNGDNEDTVVKEIYIDAATEDVFPYLTNPQQYVLWMGLDARIDARPGGAYQINLNGIDFAGITASRNPSAPLRGWSGTSTLAGSVSRPSMMPVRRISLWIGARSFPLRTNAKRAR